MPKLLWELMERGRCVAFVGAGFSMACGIPSWGQLLTELLTFARDNARNADPAKLNACQELIRKGRLIRAASELKTLFVPSETAKFFRDQFQGAIRMKVAAPAARLRMQARIDALAKAPFAGVVTTNFDDLISETGFKWVMHGDEPDLGHVLSWGERFYVRLHSSGWEGQRVLTSEDYAHAYLDGGAVKTVRPFLRALMLSYPLVFIGCSLEDRILDLRRELHQIFNRHIPAAYALLPDTEENRDREETLLKFYDIRSILYPIEKGKRAGHWGLDRFLEELAACRHKTKISFSH